MCHTTANKYTAYMNIANVHTSSYFLRKNKSAVLVNKTGNGLRILVMIGSDFFERLEFLQHSISTIISKQSNIFINNLRQQKSRILKV